MSPSPSPMGSGMGEGMPGMHSGMEPMSMGPDILPVWVTWLWLAALVAVLVVHCAHLLRREGQHRWYHASHILMIVSMIYMFASMEYSWTWFPARWWVVIFTASSVAIAAWMVARIARHRPVSILWLLALIMQASMIYMWLPTWIAVVTWILVAYFTVETVGWLAGVIDDSDGRHFLGSGPRHECCGLAHPSPVSNVSMAVMSASMAYMFAAMQFMR